MFIHHYDDAHVAAGQGTIGLELAADGQLFDDFVIPTGGGSFFASIATALSEVMPRERLTGVEAAHYPSTLAALRGKEAPKPGPTLAEGIAVKALGKLTLLIIRDRVDKIILVDEGSLEIAVGTLADIVKTVVEGAGAASLAAVMTEPKRFRSRRICLILSGGNIDEFILAQALLSGLAREWGITRLQVQTPDRPGSLALATHIIAKEGGNIFEVRHERLSFDVQTKATQIDFVLETEGRRHLDHIVAALRQAEIEAEPMSPLRPTSINDAR
jgi:threonine dehydratase